MQSTPNRQHYDLVISGAGPAGLACAAMIHTYRPDLHICLIDAKPGVEPNQARHLALSHGSVELLKNCLLWPKSAGFGSPIHAVHVSQQGRLGQTLMTASALNVPELGWMLNYSALVAALTQTFSQNYPSIPIVRPDSIANVEHLSHSAKPNTSTVHSAAAADYPLAITLQSGQTLFTHLLIHAEGGVFHLAGTAVHDERQSYDQTAVLSVVNIQGLPPQQAWERFTQSGPVAMLPLGGQRYSLVWCVANDAAHALMQLTEQDKKTQLAQIFGQRFSAQAIEFETTMQAYPLGLAWKHELTSPHTLTLGNAAQTLHPVAGQGLNLALRDCYCLAEVLAHAHDKALWDQALQTYSAQRQTDRKTTKTVTDSMARVFATPKPLIQHALGLGLLSLDLFKPAKRWVGNSLLWGQR